MTQLLTIIFGLFGGVAHAAIKSVNIIYPFPGSDTSFSDPVAYISAVYKFGLGLTGLFGFGALVWGGVNYVISGDNISKRTDARGQIRDAFIGILMLVSSVLILNEINPQILQTTLLLEPAAAPNISSGASANAAKDNTLLGAMRAWNSPSEGNTDDILTAYLALSEQDRQLVLSQLDARSRNILDQALQIKKGQEEVAALLDQAHATVNKIQNDSAYRAQLQTSVQNKVKTLTAAQRQSIENILNQLPNATQDLPTNLNELDKQLQNHIGTMSGGEASGLLHGFLGGLGLTEDETTLLFVTSSPTDLSRLLGTGSTANTSGGAVATGGATDITRFGVGGALRALPSSNRGSLTDVLRSLPQGSTVQDIINSPFSATNAQITTIQNALSAMSLADGDSFKAKTPRELLDLIGKIQ